jgi:hypothetical protein
VVESVDFAFTNTHTKHARTPFFLTSALLSHAPLCTSLALTHALSLWLIWGCE